MKQGHLSEMQITEVMDLTQVFIALSTVAAVTAEDAMQTSESEKSLARSEMQITEVMHLTQLFYNGSQLQKMQCK